MVRGLESSTQSKPPREARSRRQVVRANLDELVENDLEVIGVDLAVAVDVDQLQWSEGWDGQASVSVTMLLNLQAYRRG